ncbi:polysaccharide deacetylase family protein [Arsenicicoccus dermatophilus]|uniref:polysaccharide deacetylase family protein n=1 Tax=Arsenicicoccus dermatophilus TaxID=1076331 RepID=UPI001F4C9F85|nr:polysaccharide deacetylase family protein [Arsenicicoccus dermatophilus]MCH8614406.1 polysaccharide deacetylase family protein [Arsenicicoccus dermatophilus]
MRWPEVPAATALNETMRAQTTRLLKEHLAQVDDQAELHVSGVVVLWSPQIAAVRLTALVPQGAKGAITHKTFYGDREGTWAAPSLDLIDPARRDDFLKTVLTRVSSQAGEDGVGDGVTAKDALTDITITPRGGLRVIIDQGIAAPLTVKNLATEIPADQAAAFLSDRGRAVVAAAQTGPEPSAASNESSSDAAGDEPSTEAATAPALPSPESVDCQARRCVALTFDDGPGPYTSHLLDELSAANVRATFFTLGQNVQAQPEVVRRAAAMGMAIGNHTWDHRDLRRLSKKQQQRELDDTERVLRPITGSTGPTLVRPPYGSFDATTKTLGHPLILWDVDTEDWKNRDVAETTRRAVEGARAGSIILMHDIHPSTVKAIPGIVKALKNKGFTLVTVPQLMGEMTPGSVIFRKNH